MNEQFAIFPLRDRARPVDCFTLGGNDSRYTLGAFTSPSPLIAVRDDVDVIVFGHVA